MKSTAVLLISCPDRKGIVATVSNFLYSHNANILHADQHRDDSHNLFFQRVEWDLTDFALDDEEFRKKFSSIVVEFQMQWKLAYSHKCQRVAVFVSREDHCLSDLLYRHKSGEIFCEIPFIVSNHPTVQKLAIFYNVPFYLIPVEKKNIKEAEGKASILLKKMQVDLLVLARYMQILSADFIKKFSKPIINIHHSFLPAFVGAKPYNQAYERGVKLIGATSHYVTATLDNGPIIEQDVIRISHRDSVEDIIRKGRDLEKIVLSRAVRWHLENRILLYANKTVIFD